MNDELERGTVVTYSPHRNYGFVKPSLGGPDVLFLEGSYGYFEVGPDRVVLKESSRYKYSLPKVGGEIVFVRCDSDRYPRSRVSAWAYQADYRKALYEQRRWPRNSDRFLVGLLPDHAEEMKKLLSLYGVLKIASATSRESAGLLQEFVGVHAHIGPDFGHQIVEVKPFPGKEKMLGRILRMCARFRANLNPLCLDILEAPHQHMYTGILEEEYLMEGRIVPVEEARMRLAREIPVFRWLPRSRIWTRILKFLGNPNKEYLLEVQLTPNLSVEQTAVILAEKPPSASRYLPDIILRTWPLAKERTLRIYQLLPDSVREDIAIIYGTEAATRLLSEDFSCDLSFWRLLEAQRITEDRWASLPEIAAIPERFAIKV